MTKQHCEYKILHHSTLSAVKSNIFLKCIKVKSNRKKAKYNNRGTWLFLKAKYNNRGTSLKKNWNTTPIGPHFFYCIYATLTCVKIELTDDIEDTTLRTDDFEDRRLWGRTTLRTGDFEDKNILKISTISKFAKLLKFSKIVKNIGYMMPTLGGWMFLLDICCQHLEKICNFEGFCLGNEHILLDICCQHLRIYVSWRFFCGPFGPWVGENM